ncbi:MAG: SEC-C metal-binding domain-containing protein [Candidatus Sulfotelmatobacter sp.]
MRNGSVWKRGESAHRSNKIGRNDPCPCGSGKKY